MTITFQMSSELVGQTYILPDNCRSGNEFSRPKSVFFAAKIRALIALNDRLKSLSSYPWEAVMAKQGKATLLENILALALIGILSGAVGGLAVGIVTGRVSSSSSSSSASGH
jgi:hypothetical protein